MIKSYFFEIFFSNFFFKIFFRKFLFKIFFEIFQNFFRKWLWRLSWKITKFFIHVLQSNLTNKKRLECSRSWIIEVESFKISTAWGLNLRVDLIGIPGIVSFNDRGFDIDRKNVKNSEKVHFIKRGSKKNIFWTNIMKTCFQP